jgi:6-phosphogluconolactonase
VAVLPILPNGAGVGQSVCVHTHPSGGVGAHARQDMAHPHMITLSPDQRFAFVPDLGNNMVVVYAFDDLSGQLTPHGQTLMPSGSGPRHMAFHPNEQYAYVLNELNNTISTLPYDASNGALGPPDATISALVEQPGRRSDRGGAAEIVASPDGERVYCTVRLGRDTDPMNATPAFPFGVEYNVVATLAVTKDGGGLALLSNVASGGSMPWGCVLVPGAGHGGGEDLLLVQNQYGAWEGDGKGTGGGGVGKLTAFTSGTEAGATLVGNHADIDNFMCIAVASCDDSEVVMKPQL